MHRRNLTSKMMLISTPTGRSSFAELFESAKADPKRDMLKDWQGQYLTQPFNCRSVAKPFQKPLAKNNELPIDAHALG